MHNDAIQMPEVSELKEELTIAKNEIQNVLNEEPELESQGKFIMEVLSVIEDRLNTTPDLNKLNRKDRISIMAHLNLFYSLLDDLFFDDLEDLDEEELEMEFADEDEEEEDKK